MSERKIVVMDEVHYANNDVVREQLRKDFIARIVEFESQQKNEVPQEKTYAQLFETPKTDELYVRFSTGRGVIQLLPDMTDEMMLITIKHAVSMSKGTPFVVVTS